jgi:acetyl esterase/lipase
MSHLHLVDPELRDMALRMQAMTASYSPLSMAKLEQRRATIAAMAPAWTAGIAVEERRIAADAAHAAEVTIFIVNAKPGGAGPAILHLHGGGFNAGSSRAAMCQIQELARQLDCVVVSVEYRLAPETPFPGALQDNFAALRWMHEHADEIGADTARIAVLGESAGGGHAAMLTLAARGGSYPICFQALIYPMLDDRTGTSRAVPEHIGAFGWNAESNRFGWECFLGQTPGTPDVPRAAVPARCENLAGLPPTFIGVGALDLFVSENIIFANRLIEAAVPTELMVVPGATHGFDTLAPLSAAAQRFTAAKLAALRRGQAAGQ